MSNAMDDVYGVGQTFWLNQETSLLKSPTLCHICYPFIQTDEFVSVNVRGKRFLATKSLKVVSCRLYTVLLNVKQNMTLYMVLHCI